MNRAVVVILFAVCLLLSSTVTAQDVKNIRGQVVDRDSKFPIAGANVLLVGSNPPVGVQADTNGYFTLPNVPLGRASIRISYIGYKDAYANDILVIAGKENQLTIELEEKVSELKEVQVTDKVEKGQAKNEFATVSARSFDVEQI
jgi:hypothetical protein